MKKHSFILSFPGIFVFTLFFWRCAEDPIKADLLHFSLTIDTLSISEITGEPYWIAPNLGSTNNLYLGKKNDLDAFISFIGFPDYYNWAAFLDSNSTFDSLHFVVYSNDSLLTPASTPALFFSPDSQFSESKSTYLDFSEFTTTDWVNLGLPEIKIDQDTSGNFNHTELIWDILTLFDALTDTSDSNLVRTFVLEPVNDDSIFLELFSRESQQTNNPKIITYFRRTTVISDDSTQIDTITSPLGASGDISIIDPGDSIQDSSFFGVSSGFGLRSVLSFPFDSLSLPEGSLIRSAILSMPLDSSTMINNFTIVIDPLNVELDTLTDLFDTDPYSVIGYPYRVNSDTKNGLLEISLKSYLQNITLGNVPSIGFKILASDQNDPFDKIHFDLSGNLNPGIIRIVYAWN